MDFSPAPCTPGSSQSPTNGTEPHWDPDHWKTNERYNNCYAYAVNNHVSSEVLRDHKPSPGNVRGIYTCSKIMEGLKADLPNLYPITFDCPCQPGYKKIYSAVSERDEDGDNDFHFWRLDQDGLWSHKPGSNPPLRVDGSNHPIKNPEQSDRRMGPRSYSQSCGFFCVPEL